MLKTGKGSVGEMEGYGQRWRKGTAEKDSRSKNASEGKGNVYLEKVQLLVVTLVERRELGGQPGDALWRNLNASLDCVQ